MHADVQNAPSNAQDLNPKELLMKWKGVRASLHSPRINGLAAIVVVAAAILNGYIHNDDAGIRTPDRGTLIVIASCSWH